MKTFSSHSSYLILSAFFFFIFCGHLNAQIALEEIPLTSDFSFVFQSDKPIAQKMGSAKSWVAKNFGDYKSVLQFEDSENRQLIIKGTAPMKTSVSGDVVKITGNRSANFIMTFDFKEDRYRIKFEDITIHTSIDLGSTKNAFDYDSSVEEHLKYDTSKKENQIAELRVKLEDLKAKDTRRMRKIDKQLHESEIARTQSSIDKLTNYVLHEAEEEHLKDVLLFQSTFCILVNSAAKAINFVDEF